MGRWVDISFSLKNISSLVNILLKFQKLISGNKQIFLGEKEENIFFFFQKKKNISEFCYKVK